MTLFSSEFEGDSLPDYLNVLNGYNYEIQPFVAASGVAVHGVPMLRPDYSSQKDGRAWPSGEVGHAYIAHNEQTAQAEASDHSYTNYIAYSGYSVNIMALPEAARTAFLNPEDYGPSIAIRNSIYEAVGPVALIWDSLQNPGNPAAFIPSGTWSQAESKPVCDSNKGLYFENPTWFQGTEYP